MTHSSERASFLLVSALLGALGLAGPPQAAQRGVVVEEVSKGSSGERAGIRVGDVLIRWERSASPPANPQQADGEIALAFDWLWVEIEQGPRATLHAWGERDGKEIKFEMAVGDLGLRIRPRFNDKPLAIYTAGKAAVDAKQLENGVAHWGQVVNLAAADGDSELAFWMELRIGETWMNARRWEEAETAFAAARARPEMQSNRIAQGAAWEFTGIALSRQTKYQDAEIAHRSALAARTEGLDETLSAARSLSFLGSVAYARRDLDASDAYYQRVLAIRERLAPDSLELADVLANLGRGASDRRELASSAAYHTRALAIRETRVPDSLDVAGSLDAVAMVARQRGDLDTAEPLQKRALTIRETLSPNSRNVAASLANLGNLAWRRGELGSAEAYYRRTMPILEKLAPNSFDAAGLLNNLGNVAWARGELASAEAFYQRAMVIQEQLAPGSLDVAMSLSNLGNVALGRGELAGAEASFKRALALRETLAPDSLSETLTGLGEVARRRGAFAEAEAFYSRALAIEEKLGPDGFAVALAYNNLGDVARARGDLAVAERHYARAMGIQERLSPDSLDLATTLSNLGATVRARGDLGAAAADIERALRIRAKRAPGSEVEAESLHALGLISRKTNQIQLAADQFRRSIDALESQVGKLGGGQETQSGFIAQFSVYYRDYIDLLIEQNRLTEAFHVLERSRARTLLTMLAERDLVFSADVPEDIDNERKRMAWEYDQAQARLAQLNPLTEQSQIDGLLTRLRELRDRQSNVADRIRQQSPRLAALQYPQPLNSTAVQAALDPGTVLLSYSVGADKSYVFVLTAGVGITVHPLGVGEAQLRDEIGRFRAVIGRAELGATSLTGLVDLGRRLYDVLIQPAAGALEKATRVLVVPDGPLHVLPFAALVRGVDVKTTRAQRDWQYLVEWKPIHVVVSATVYDETRREPPNRQAKKQPKTLIAFGDPKYPPVASATDEKALDSQDAIVRSMLTRGYRLTPLPATNGEVAAIAELYRGRADRYLGEAATEERAKGVAKDARYLHFASHGLLDERFPLNSGLALTIPADVKEGQDNGILQAWEIFERVRIDADLVVLSACETGLGKEMGGEGLVGLTRAFQYAGARSVLATLWSVADETTASLMKRFYGHLRAGRSKDAALRQAQLDLIRGTIVVQDEETRTRLDASHPFYWAAFQLNGDWR